MRQSLAGVLLMATAVGHALVGVVLFREPLTAILEEGAINTIQPPLYVEQPHFDRIATFWFFIFSPVLFLLGQIANRAVARGDRETLRLVGWYLLGMGVIGGIMLPVSGQWSLIALAAFVFKAASATDQRVRAA